MAGKTSDPSFFLIIESHLELRVRTVQLSLSLRYFGQIDQKLAVSLGIDNWGAGNPLAGQANFLAEAQDFGDSLFMKQ